MLTYVSHRLYCYNSVTQFTRHRSISWSAFYFYSLLTVNVFAREKEKKTENQQQYNMYMFQVNEET